MANKALNNAKRAKKDEFYTRREDIERELTHYAEHFRGKTVYCNCDDPVTSEFWRFFVRNFWPYGLKKLMATHYEPDEKNFSYKLELTEMKQGQLFYEGAVKTQIPCNGDFRSAACIELLQEADIVVTNPPFSLFRDYVAQLMEYGKKFIIIGGLNAVKYKEIFPLLRDNLIWLGYYSVDMAFKVPDYYEPRPTRFWIDETGQKWRSMGNTCWFTNLDIKKRHEKLDLRGNYYHPDAYFSYENLESSINVDKLADIPCDYEGLMGVPITFMQHYNPDQFEILGLSRDMDLPGKTGMSEQFIHDYFAQGGTAQISVGHPDLCYYGKGRKAVVPYHRVIIRNKDVKKREN